MDKKMYDLIIIGGGPAGLTACLYALRSRLKTLLVDKMQVGGYLGYIDNLENYPGFENGISGKELTARIVKQVEKYGFEFLLKDVKNIEREGSDWSVAAEDVRLGAKTVIIAFETDYPDTQKITFPFNLNKDKPCVDFIKSTYLKKEKV